MDLLLSCLLLVFFVVVVDYTAVGSVGDGIVGLFGGLFSHPDNPPWPKGVQEDGDQRLLSLVALPRPGRHTHAAGAGNDARQAAAVEERGDALDGWFAAEIIDDVPPVPVASVRRLS